jgi:hypothetical protein
MNCQDPLPGRHQQPSGTASARWRNGTKTRWRRDHVRFDPGWQMTGSRFGATEESSTPTRHPRTRQRRCVGRRGVRHAAGLVRMPRRPVTARRYARHARAATGERSRNPCDAAVAVPDRFSRKGALRSLAPVSAGRVHGGARKRTSTVSGRSASAESRCPDRERDGDACRPTRPYRDQSGYSSLRQARGSAGSGFGVRSSRNAWYGATNGSGAITV